MAEMTIRPEEVLGSPGEAWSRMSSPTGEVRRWGGGWAGHLLGRRIAIVSGLPAHDVERACMSFPGELPGLA